MGLVFPVHVDELTPEILSALISEEYPGTIVSGFNLVDKRMHGDGMASTAGRMVLDLDYLGDRQEDLPRRVILKVARADRFSQPLYVNEVAVYREIRPSRLVEAPRCYGAAYDVDSATFGLILEDMTLRGAEFPNVTTTVSVAYLRSILDQLAILHARYWASPLLDGGLPWLQTHVSGEIYHFFMDADRLPAHIEQEVRETQFKREMVERLGLTPKALHRLTADAQAHQSRLVQTLVHGDTHLGNTYKLPGDKGGLVDWQLAVRGHFMHDVGYLIATGLSVAQRRQHERDLLTYYLDRLRAEGLADAPTFDATWGEYRRAQAWNVYIGWLTTPVVNYGWEITVANHLRVMTAFEDLKTAEAVAEVS
jgi:hypothetical protein